MNLVDIFSLLIGDTVFIDLHTSMVNRPSYMQVNQFTTKKNIKKYIFFSYGLSTFIWLQSILQANFSFLSPTLLRAFMITSSPLSHLLCLTLPFGAITIITDLILQNSVLRQGIYQDQVQINYTCFKDQRVNPIHQISNWVLKLFLFFMGPITY